MPVVRARNAFEEEEGADAIEPAVLIDTDDSFILVDPRMGPRTEKSQAPIGWERYERGGKGWSSRVFAGAVRDVAGEEGPFGLLKLWLLGSYMAELAGKAFVLLHVTPAWSGTPLLAKLQPQFVSGPERQASSLTWEDIYEHVDAECADARDAQAVLTYFREKSAGYGADGRLRRAFAVPEEPPDVDAVSRRPVRLVAEARPRLAWAAAPACCSTGAKPRSSSTSCDAHHPIHPPAVRPGRVQSSRRFEHTGGAE